jgi:hypothetical protein
MKVKGQFHSLAVLPPWKGRQYTLRLVGPQDGMKVLETTEDSASVDSGAPDHPVSVPSTLSCMRPNRMHNFCLNKLNVYT